MRTVKKTQGVAKQYNIPARLLFSGVWTVLLVLATLSHLVSGQPESAAVVDDQGACFYPDNDLFTPSDQWSYSDTGKWPQTCLEEQEEEEDVDGRKQGIGGEGSGHEGGGGGEGKATATHRNLQSPVNLPRKSTSRFMFCWRG